VELLPGGLPTPAEGLSQSRYLAYIAASWASIPYGSETMKLNAPDHGHMEVLSGSARRRRRNQWLKAAAGRRDPLGYAMTERAWPRRTQE